MILIRVYTGGFHNHQSIPFLSAWNNVSNWYPNVLIEYFSIVDIKELNYGPHDLVNWLLKSDIHFIITHIHQGMRHWDCYIVRQSLKKLKYHVGFPSGEELDCPFFTQDKYAYLSILPDICNPSLQFLFPKDTALFYQRPDIRERVQKFLREQCNGNGWVIKLPYVTNRDGISFREGEDGVFSALFNANSRNYRVHYGIVQARLRNRKE